jgi:hypothetical protein
MNTKQLLAILLTIGSLAIPVQAEGNNKSLTVSKSTKSCSMYHHNTVHKIVPRPNFTQYEKS